MTTILILILNENDKLYLYFHCYTQLKILYRTRPNNEQILYPPVVKQQLANTASCLCLTDQKCTVKCTIFPVLPVSKKPQTHFNFAEMN